MSAKGSSGSRSEQSNDDDRMLDFGRYVEIVNKRKWIILATCIVGVALTVLYTSRQTKLYSAAAKIVVDPNAPSVFGTNRQEVVTLGTNNYWSSQEYYNTQIEIIDGYDLARITVMTPLVDSGLVPFKDPRLLPPEIVEGKSEDERIKIATDILDGSIKSGLIPDTRIIAISVTHKDPELARDLANAHAETYKKSNLSLRRVSNEDASEFLAPKRDLALKTLRDAEEGLLQYKLENNLLTTPVERQASQASSEVERYSSAYADSKIKRIQIEALRARAKAAMTGDVLTSPIFGLSETGSTGARALKDQYTIERQRFVDLGKDLLDKHPSFIAQKLKVDNLYDDIRREAELAMREIEERYQAALSTEREQRNEKSRAMKAAIALQRPNAEVSRLEMELRRAQRNYDEVRSRVEQIEESQENPVGNVRSHETARTPMVHTYPRMKTNVAMAFALSLLLGLAIALLLEYLDRTIKSVEDVEIASGVPLLGMIPGLEEIPVGEGALQERDLYVFRNPTSRAAECARSIRTNILFSGADKKLNTITVSSPNPREGKTTSVMYLGTTMAQSGQRVLLIDTDLRRPRLHKSLGIPRGRGVTNLILGDAEYDEVIKTTDIPNLWVLPCGPTPPNPAELLLTDRFKEILSDLSEKYDWVILDSPPLNAVTDAVVLSRLSDGAILVVQAGQTLREDLVRVRRQLADVDANVLGVILNDLDLSDKKHGYYYYAYGYSESEAEAESS